MSLPSQTIQERALVPFAGLAPRDGHVEVPRVVADELDLPRYPDRSFKEVIEALPCAERRTVYIDNSFVHDNGIVAADDIKSLMDSDDSMGGQLDAYDQGTDNPFDVGRQSPKQQARGATAIVDPRREALAALGYDVDYYWQIASGEYTIVNPTDWYYRCYQTLEKRGKREPIGWVEYDDYGGTVDLYVLLPSERFVPPTMDNNNEADRRPVYLGYTSGYRFDGDRALDFELFGFDCEHQSAYWGLGESKNRRHRGNVMDDAKEWWEAGYETISDATSIDGNLLKHVDEASTLKMDFTDDDSWSPTEFVTCLGLPPTYAEEIVDDAQAMAAEPDIISIWNFYININRVINAKYTVEGKSRNSMTFQGYARTGRKLLREPKSEIKRARRKYEEASEDGPGTDEAQQTLADSIDNISGVIQNESELSALEKLRATEDVQKSLEETLG